MALPPVIAREVIKLSFHTTPFRLLPVPHGTIPDEQAPHTKTNNIQDYRMAGTQCCFQAGYGNKGGKQEKYSRFHTLNILNYLVIRKLFYKKV